MAQKKDRSRFSIKFRENDPAHERTICILESQGQRNIAPFLVNAVLHYVQCSETPDLSRMLIENSQPQMDKAKIENIVKEILLQQGIIKEEVDEAINKEITTEKKFVLNDRESKKTENIMSQVQVDDNMRAIISRTLSVLRNE